MNILPPRNFGTQAPSQGQVLVPQQKILSANMASSSVGGTAPKIPASVVSSQPKPQSPVDPIQQPTQTLSTVIDRWRDTDAKIRSLTQALAQQRAIKTSISSELIRIMEHDQLGAIDLKNGKIRLVTDQPFKVITKKALNDILSKYQDASPAQIKSITDFIMNNRERNPETKRIVHIDKL